MRLNVKTNRIHFMRVEYYWSGDEDFEIELSELSLFLLISTALAESALSSFENGVVFGSPF